MKKGATNKINFIPAITKVDLITSRCVLNTHRINLILYYSIITPVIVRSHSYRDIARSTDVSLSFFFFFLFTTTYNTILMYEK